MLASTLLATGLLVGQRPTPASVRGGSPALSLHTLAAIRIDGAEVPMESLAGKPVLMVNVASR